MIKRSLFIYFLIAYGSLNNGSSSKENITNVIATDNNSSTQDLESILKKELLHIVQIIRLWNSNMKLNNLQHEKELKDLKSEIKLKIKEFIMIPAKKEKAERLRAMVKSLKNILVKKKSKWLVDRVFKDMCNRLKNDFDEITQAEFINTKKFLEQYKKYLVDLNDVCNKCYDEFTSSYNSWEDFEFKLFTRKLKDFSLLVQPDEIVFVGLDKCMQLFESIYSEKFVSCELS